MTKAVSVENLFFSYDSTPILEDVSLTINEGEFVGIFGPNGGGKTTFLKILIGLLKPSKGSIRLFGSPPKHIQPLIGYVPQITKLDRQFPITVEEVVQMGCLKQESFLGTLPTSAKTIAEISLKKVDMLSHKKRPFGTLSGGQAQRVLIARALACQPKILVLDEPTASVDPKAEEEILQILTSLKKEITILMVTHDLPTILQKVEKLLCIHRHAHVLSPSAVCEHYGLGLYHSPLMPKTLP